MMIISPELFDKQTKWLIRSMRKTNQKTPPVVRATIRQAISAIKEEDVERALDILEDLVV